MGHSWALTKAKKSMIPTFLEAGDKGLLDAQRIFKIEDKKVFDQKKPRPIVQVFLGTEKIFVSNYKNSFPDGRRMPRN